MVLLIRFPETQSLVHTYTSRYTGQVSAAGARLQDLEALIYILDSMMRLRHSCAYISLMYLGVWYGDRCNEAGDMQHRLLHTLRWWGASYALGRTPGPARYT